jgi:hypothetical protein
VRDVEVTPAPTDEERRVLMMALGVVDAGTSAADRYLQPWRAAGLREAVDDEDEVRYAFSPRSTRGATRA